jgi:hypothetical protein
LRNLESPSYTLEAVFEPSPWQIVVVAERAADLGSIYPPRSG